ncbi:MAG: hypothetical protein QN168_12545 [Armatimonadota bacterium]|nr:hypothetical protein [Armatimonadota bacterium]
MARRGIFRRLFYRPAEIVIGYDEGVLDARAVGAVRALWSGVTPVRTMPFRRTESDPAAPLLVTFGDVTARLPAPPPRAVCAALARSLAEAGLQPLRLMVRMDYRGIIVRGDVDASLEEPVAAALEHIAELAALAKEAVDHALPEGAELLMATYDVQTGHWVLREARGYRGTMWRKQFYVGHGWVEAV